LIILPKTCFLIVSNFSKKKPSIILKTNQKKKIQMKSKYFVCDWRKKHIHYIKLYQKFIKNKKHKLNIYDFNFYIRCVIIEKYIANILIKI